MRLKMHAHAISTDESERRTRVDQCGQSDPHSHDKGPRKRREREKISSVCARNRVLLGIALHQLKDQPENADRNKQQTSKAQHLGHHGERDGQAVVRPGEERIKDAHQHQDGYCDF